MRKVLISAAAAVSAVAFAAPAAAQYYPAPPPPQAYGYNGYGNDGYGYNDHRSVRRLQARIDLVQRQINRLDREDRMSERSADRLRAESARLEHQLRLAARHGLNPYEAIAINRRIALLEDRVLHNSVSRYTAYNRYNGGGWSDRDRDGRDDRYEDDRGYRHD